jgi:hypothetical protein
MTGRDKPIDSNNYASKRFYSSNWLCSILRLCVCVCVCVFVFVFVWVWVHGTFTEMEGSTELTLFLPMFVER